MFTTITQTLQLNQTKSVLAANETNLQVFISDRLAYHKNCIITVYNNVEKTKNSILNDINSPFTITDEQYEIFIGKYRCLRIELLNFTKIVEKLFWGSEFKDLTESQEFKKLNDHLKISVYNKNFKSIYNAINLTFTLFLKFVKKIPDFIEKIKISKNNGEDWKKIYPLVQELHELESMFKNFKVEILKFINSIKQEILFQSSKVSTFTNKSSGDETGTSNLHVSRNSVESTNGKDEELFSFKKFLEGQLDFVYYNWKSNAKLFELNSEYKDCSEYVSKLIQNIQAILNFDSSTSVNLGVYDKTRFFEIILISYDTLRKKINCNFSKLNKLTHLEDKEEKERNILMKFCCEVSNLLEFTREYIKKFQDFVVVRNDTNTEVNSDFLTVFKKPIISMNSILINIIDDRIDFLRNPIASEKY